MCNILARRMAYGPCNAQHWYAAMGLTQRFRRVVAIAASYISSLLESWHSGFYRRHSKCDSHFFFTANKHNKHAHHHARQHSRPSLHTYRKLSNSRRKIHFKEAETEKLHLPRLLRVLCDGGDVLFSCVSKPSRLCQRHWKSRCASACRRRL